MIEWRTLLLVLAWWVSCVSSAVAVLILGIVYWNVIWIIIWLLRCSHFPPKTTSMLSPHWSALPCNTHTQRLTLSVFVDPPHLSQVIQASPGGMVEATIMMMMMMMVASCWTMQCLSCLLFHSAGGLTLTCCTAAVWFQALKLNKAFAENSCLSYRTSLAIWDHTVLPATWHKW